MRVVDLSYLITENIPVYPGTPPPAIINNASVQADGYAEKQLNFNTHTGTHVDSPAHMISAANTLDRLPVDRFMGRARLLDCRGLKRIDQQLLQSYADGISQCDYLVFHTGWSRYWGQDAYFRNFPVLTTGAAEYLSRFELKGIGLDCCSVDPVSASDFPIHRILFARDLLIVENLTALADIGTDQFTFCCFPLKILDADGSPVRAVGIVNIG